MTMDQAASDRVRQSPRPRSAVTRPTPCPPGPPGTRYACSVRKVAVAVLVLLLVVVGLPVATGHLMGWCPECLAASGLLIVCLAVLAAGMVLVPLRVEWLRTHAHPWPRSLVPALLDRPPRSA